jgi:hypothetical protein
MASRAKDPGHFLEDRGGGVDKTKDRHRNDDVEAFVRKRQALRRRHPKIDADPFLRRPPFGRLDRRSGSIDPDDARAAFRKFDRKIAVPASDVENAATANVPDQV